jgi:hypothetical protein
VRPKAVPTGRPRCCTTALPLGALLLGLLVFGLMLVIEPVAMRHNRGAEREEALAVAGEVPDERAAEEDLAPAGSRE